MRNLLLFLALTLFLNAEERYCIEVLSTVDKETISKDFMLKVNETTLPHSVKYIDGKYKVLMGDFKTREEAESAIFEVHEKVSKEAIVSVYQEPKKPLELNPNAKMQQAMLMAQAKMITKPVKQKEKVPQDANLTVKPVDVTGPQENEKIAIKDEQVEKIADKKVEKQEVKTKEIPKEQFCKPTKKALREEEIAEALTFYKNSSFYKFKN